VHDLSIIALASTLGPLQKVSCEWFKPFTWEYRKSTTRILWVKHWVGLL